MANKKISALDAAAALTGAEETVVVQAGEDRRTTTQDIADVLLDNTAVFTKQVSLTPVARGAQSAAGTLTLDFATGNNFTATFGAGNLTIANPTNVAAGQSGLLALTQDSVGGRTVSWGGNWKFAGATAPTLSSAADAVDLISFVAVSATVIVATLAVADYR